MDGCPFTISRLLPTSDKQGITSTIKSMFWAFWQIRISVHIKPWMSNSLIDLSIMIVLWCITFGKSFGIQSLNVSNWSMCKIPNVSSNLRKCFFCGYKRSSPDTCNVSSGRITINLVFEQFTPTYNNVFRAEKCHFMVPWQLAAMLLLQREQ